VQKKNSSGVYKPLLQKVVTSTALETYSWKYKPLKKGSYRMQASVPASGKILAGKTAYKAFVVKSDPFYRREQTGRAPQGARPLFRGPRLVTPA